jgi:hypothetical protein
LKALRVSGTLCRYWSRDIGDEGMRNDMIPQPVGAMNQLLRLAIPTCEGWNMEFGSVT